VARKIGELVLANGNRYSLAIEDGKRLHAEDFTELVEGIDEINDAHKNFSQQPLQFENTLKPG
jgi:hypothetical protein